MAFDDASNNRKAIARERSTVPYGSITVNMCRLNNGTVESV